MVRLLAGQLEAMEACEITYDKEPCYVYASIPASKGCEDAPVLGFVDSRFAIPVFDENNDVLRYNVFHAELVIRHSENRKLYLYDIINIKKETSTPLEP